MLFSRYPCAPGLAYDDSDRVCKWADQVTRCKELMKEEEKDSVFTCPDSTQRGIYSKHPHPQDCRQYFVCIGGSAREYGCPLGSVFKITQNQDGVCADPGDVPECSNYYGKNGFNPKNGFNTKIFLTLIWFLTLKMVINLKMVLTLKWFYLKWV